MRKTNLLFVLLFLCSAWANRLSAQNFNWVLNIAGAGTVNSTHNVLIDGTGNIYAVGHFEGTIDFDPGPATYTLSAPTWAGGMFVQKLDAGGNFVWAKVFKGTATNDGMAILPAVAMDATGNIIIGGAFAGTVDFDPGSAVLNLTTSGNWDAFFLKMDSNGNLLWAKTIGASGLDDVEGITTDNSGNIYCTGRFSNTVDFDPGPGVANLTNPSFNEGTHISKYTSSGTYVWAKAIVGNSGTFVEGSCIQIDGLGNVITAGQFNGGTPDFDPGPGVYSISTIGNSNTFLCSLNSSGNFLWAGATAGSANQLPSKMLADASNNIYLIGLFNGTADFDMGTSTYNMTSAGAYDVFTAKYSQSGAFIWGKSTGGAADEFAFDMQFDVAGNLNITGTFKSGPTLDFDPGPGVANLKLMGNVNTYYQKLNASGAYLGAFSFARGGNQPYSIATDAGGNLFIAGTYSGSVDFDPDLSTTLLTNTSSGKSGYLCKLSACSGISGTVTATSGPVAGNANLYQYKSPGKLDSINTVSINVSGSYSIPAVGSGSYIVKATPIATSLDETYGNLISYWKNAPVISHSCVINSSQNINVIAFPTASGSVSISGKILEGNGYGHKGAQKTPGNPIKGITVKGGKNPGGTSASRTVTNANGEYTLSGLPANATGEHYFILVDIPGLDTNLTYHRIFMNNPESVSGIDFSVDSIQVNPINLSLVGISNLVQENVVYSIYPNPVSGQLNVSLELKTNTEVCIELHDLSGRIIRSILPQGMQERGKLSVTSQLTDIEPGVYFVSVKTGNQKRISKVIISH